MQIAVPIFEATQAAGEPLFSEPSVNLEQPRNSPRHVLEPVAPVGRRLLKSAAEAARLLAEAEKAKAAIIKAAEEKASEIAHRARVEGYEAGRQEALTTLLSASVLKRRLLETARREMVEISISVAESVLQTALEEQPESIETRVLSALEYARSQQELTLSVHPGEGAFIRSSLESGRLKPFAPRIAVEEDSELPRGAARLKTSLGEIEATPGEHLAALRSALLKTADQFLPDASDLIPLLDEQGSLNES